MRLFCALIRRLGWRLRLDHVGRPPYGGGWVPCVSRDHAGWRLPPPPPRVPNTQCERVGSDVYVCM